MTKMQLRYLTKNLREGANIICITGKSIGKILELRSFNA
jgi:hypothetical protein